MTDNFNLTDLNYNPISVESIDSDSLACATSGINSLAHVTQWDLDKAVADAVGVANAEIGRLKAENLRIAAARIEAVNKFHLYRQKVGVELFEYFDELGDAWDETVTELFESLEIEDHLPTQEYTVTLLITTSVNINVSARSEEHARKMVEDGDVSAHDIYQEISHYEMEWEIQNIERY